MKTTPCPLCGNVGHDPEYCPEVVYRESPLPDGAASRFTTDEILAFVERMSDTDFFKFVSRSTSTPTKSC